MAQVSSNFLHNLFSGGKDSGTSGNTTADYIINVNMPAWGSGKQAVEPVNKKPDKSLIFLGGLLFLIVSTLIIVSVKGKSKAA